MKSLVGYSLVESLAKVNLPYIGRFLQVATAFKNLNLKPTIDYFAPGTYMFFAKLNPNPTAWETLIKRWIVDANEAKRKLEPLIKFTGDKILKDFQKNVEIVYTNIERLAESIPVNAVDFLLGVDEAYRPSRMTITGITPYRKNSLIIGCKSPKDVNDLPETFKYDKLTFTKVRVDGSECVYEVK